VPTAKLWRIFQDQHDSVTANFAILQAENFIPDSAIKITDQQLRAYYDAHKDDFKRPAVAFLSYLTMSRQPDAADSAAARYSVTRVRAELMKGANFADVAKRVSDDTASAVKGGDLGEVNEGSMIPVFEKATLALKPGEISQPILSQFGYHLIKLESR